MSAARAPARRSHLPARELTLVDRHRTYADNDPAAAAPAGNAFLRHLKPFLRRIARQSTPMSSFQTSGWAAM